MDHLLILQSESDPALLGEPAPPEAGDPAGEPDLDLDRDLDLDGDLDPAADLGDPPDLDDRAGEPDLRDAGDPLRLRAAGDDLRPSPDSSESEMLAFLAFSNRLVLRSTSLSSSSVE